MEQSETESYQFQSALATLQKEMIRQISHSRGVPTKTIWDEKTSDGQIPEFKLAFTHHLSSQLVRPTLVALAIKTANIKLQMYRGNLAHLTK